MANCGCPEPCPDPLNIEENIGCIQNVNSECVTYNGDNITCMGIVNGNDLSAIIKALALELCAIEDSLTTFSCSDLNSCSITNLGDVTTTSPTSGQYLSWSGTQWVNTNFPTIPSAFTCSMLGTCNINALADVNASPTNGQVLSWNSGTNTWVATTPSIGNTYTVNNGLTETPSGNFKLGGLLTGNTTITGGNFDLILGTSSSNISNLKVYANKINIRGTVLSLNESDESTQTKGFRYETTGTSLSIGSGVFNTFSAHANDVFRIGNNITLASTNILVPISGMFLGADIDVDSSVAFAIGSDITLSESLGFYMGNNLSVSNFGGGAMFGDHLTYTAGGTGNQSCFLFGSQITVTHGAGVNQGNMVFNPVNSLITSSTTGTGTREKIRSGVANKVWNTYNADGHYFFTDSADNTGWANNTSVVKLMKNFIKISQSTGSPAEAEEGCIRYNTSLNKLQVYTGSSWETVTSS